ncbi:MAG: right-handed parallel beta-helix repeat-containing protein [Calditrichaceae bacterium]|nr:right-handed parallel beta-helix repeat-containing protein [Calditrichaceae bacterium]RQV92799.1 MAG: right-handed parallel beta-helix repeat-containing protein [Calditrichota bacterium]
MKKIIAPVVILLFLIINNCSCNREGITGSPFDPFGDYVFEEPPVTGNTFYIDPVNGSAGGDGSYERPWRTLQEVVENNLIECYQPSENYNPSSPLKIVNEGAPVKGGDRLVLRSGYHGYFKRSVFVFKDWLTIAAEEGHTPVLCQFRIEGAFEKIYLKNLTFLKESYQGDEEYWKAEVLNRNNNSCVVLTSSSFWGAGSQVKLNGLTVKTAQDVSGWDTTVWQERAASGISLRSVKNAEIVNCYIENIRFGINIEYHSDYSYAVNNIINNYSGDGARLISDNVLFAYNTITNCYKVDGNHDDAIQSYSRGVDNSAGTGVLKNVVIRGNLIIGTPDRNNPLAGNPQGIGCFDGMFDNWIVENNVVVTDHYHGITFSGMRNGLIFNNTVIDQIPGNDTSPWIHVNPHKNGTPSENCIVANNIVSSSVSVNALNSEQTNNFIFGKNNHDQIYHYFTDPDDYDFHLLSNDSTTKYMIDKGRILEGIISVKIDKDQTGRSPVPDLGAYEAH